MTTIKAFSARHPLAAFVALTFAITWGGILLVVGPGGMSLDEEHFFALILFGYPAMFAGPTVAGLLLTGLAHGKAGYRELLARLLRWRVGARWYAVALLTAPLSILAVLLSLSLASPAFHPRLFIEEDWFSLAWYSVVAGLMTALFEELGWTGFALPALLARRRGVLAAGLITGLLFAAWSLPLIALAEVSNPTPGAIPLVIFVPVALFTWQTAYRVLIAWVYARTGSLLVATLMAASLVASWTSLNNPSAQTQATLVAFYVALAVVWCAIGAVVTAADDRRRARPALRPRAA